MLRIYDTIIEFIRRIAPVIDEIEKRDRDLGRQLRKSAPSMALNTAESSAGRAGTRMQRYRDALGSARRRSRFGTSSRSIRRRSTCSTGSGRRWRRT
jgi:hypothetical protein